MQNIFDGLLGLVILGMPCLAMAQSTTTSAASADQLQTKGPLLISEPDASIRIVKTDQKQTCLFLSTRLSVLNLTNSDMHLALIGAALSAVDDLGFDLAPHSPQTYSGVEVKIGGIYVVDGAQESWDQTIQQNKKDFSLLRPGQNMSIIIEPTGYVPGVSYTQNCVSDQDGTFYEGHRPKSISVAGALAVVYSDNQTQIESFSLPDKSVVLAP